MFPFTDDEWKILRYNRATNSTVWSISEFSLLFENNKVWKAKFFLQQAAYTELSEVLTIFQMRFCLSLV